MSYIFFLYPFGNMAEALLLCIQEYIHFSYVFLCFLLPTLRQYVKYKYEI